MAGVGSDGLAEELRPLILRLSRRLRGQRSDAHVSDSQLLVLFRLEHGSGMTPGELAEREGVTPPSMNRTLNGLEEGGFVLRRPSADDGRKVIVEVTAAGREVVSATRQLRTAWLRDRLSALDRDERAALTAALSSLRKLADA